jgi:hypothetical protein
VKVLRVFFDVDLKRDEVLIYELRDFFIFVGLGLQPSASASARCGAEVNKDRLVLFLRRGKGLVSVSDPVYGHDVGLPVIQINS